VSERVCAATTQRGTACRGIVPLGRPHCLVHDPELAEKVAAARRRGGTMAAKVRVLQGRRQKLDSPRALVRFVSDILQDTLAGSIDPKVCNAVINAVNAQRALLEAAQFDQRLAVVEEWMSQQRAKGDGRRWGT
jgi:hypothetical protein